MNNKVRIFASTVKNNEASPHKEVKYASEAVANLITDLVINPQTNGNLVDNDPNPDSSAGIIRVQVGEEAGQPMVVCLNASKNVPVKTQHAIGHIGEIEEAGTFLGGNMRIEYAKKPNKKADPILVVAFVPNSAVDLRKKQIEAYNEGRQDGYKAGYTDGRAHGFDQGLREAILRHQQQMQAVYAQQMQQMQQMQAAFAMPPPMTSSMSFTDGDKKNDSIRFGMLEPVPVVVKLEEAAAKETPKAKEPEKAKKEDKMTYKTAASDKCENGGLLGEACDCNPCRKDQPLEVVAVQSIQDKDFPKLGEVPAKKEAWEIELEQEQRLAEMEAKEKKAEEKLQEEARLVKLKADKEAAKLPKPKFMTHKAFMADKDIKQAKQREQVELSVKIAKGEGRDYAEQLQERIQKMYGLEVPYIQLYSKKTTPSEIKKFLAENDTDLDCCIKAGLKAYNGLLAAFKEAHHYMDDEHIDSMHEQFGALSELINKVGTMYRVTWAKALYSIVKPALTDLGFKQWSFADY